jgi:hypothetical protein
VEGGGGPVGGGGDNGTRAQVGGKLDGYLLAIIN